MKLPVLNGVSTTKDYQIEFKGLNRNDYISDGEFSKMINMTTDEYPVMSTRAERGELLIDMEGVTGIICRDGYIYASKGKYLYKYNADGMKDTQYYLNLNDKKKTLLNMGAYIVVFPDKKLFNTQTAEVIEMEKQINITKGSYYQAITNSEGEVYPGTPIGYELLIDDVNISVSSGDTAPKPMAKTNYWWNTAADSIELNVYSSQQGTWNLVSGREYIGLAENRWMSKTMDVSGFEVGDSVTYNYVDSTEGKGTIVKIINTSDVMGFIIKPNEDLPKIVEYPTIKTIKIYKETPSMDYVGELNNRLYGCSSEKHEVYVSALGNPSAWYKYEGIASDSYAATIGTDGDFTGIAVYNDYVYFFKENYIHVISGTKPSNFTITTLRQNGIEKGSSKSTAVASGYLFYKSVDGIVCFNGSIGTVISDKLKIDYYLNAIAGGYKDKYYISMQNIELKRELYVYDTRTGFWCQEDEPGIESILSDGKKLLLIVSGKIITTTNGHEKSIKWLVETGDIDGGTLTKKFIHKIIIRASMEKNMRVEIMYDSDGVWRNVYAASDNITKKIVPITIIKQRCDHFKIRLSGTGNTKIFALSKIVEKGSE